MKKFQGTGVALVTPFSKSGKVDFKGLANVIELNITNGTEYLVTQGTTGETAVLSKEEKKEVIKFTVEQTAGRVPVVAGFGGNNTLAIAHDLETFDFTGIDAVLSVSPYYNKPTQKGIIEHYKVLAAASPKPIILYNVPGRTSSNIEAETTLKIANEIPNIIGIKEASGNFAQAMHLAKYRPENFLLISGDDNITLGLLAYGFDGVISVVGQAFPKIFSEMVRCGLRGDFAQARELHYKLNDITDMLFAEGNPGGVKYALEILGVCENNLRLPLVSIGEELKLKMRTAIKQLEK
ncbi:MAG: 4-hydroxy-tetrahydrodipicolinate synthase [Chitinophagales bacterium]|nr:4-hydroxy-tetrahydrodipicolinate synthase [Chitinophagales bacterium]MCO5279530.1 4-hydroxy-tetrahydrodipicolinate synthase [Chitinophagales bacterium]OJV24246.1 MAG: 4-hydroxy-tetrahydrodipicolinate synthase [Bacteroidetes bacterium 37-13]